MMKHRFPPQLRSIGRARGSRMCCLRRNCFASRALLRPASPRPVKLGLCSYTFRDFSRAQMHNGCHGHNRTSPISIQGRRITCRWRPARKRRRWPTTPPPASSSTPPEPSNSPPPTNPTIRRQVRILQARRHRGDRRRRFHPRIARVIERSSRNTTSRCAIHNHGPTAQALHPSCGFTTVRKASKARISTPGARMAQAEAFCIDVGHGCPRPTPKPLV